MVTLEAHSTALGAILDVIEISALLFDDVNSIAHINAIVPEANIITSIFIGVWHVDIILETALNRPVIEPFLPCG